MASSDLNSSISSLSSESHQDDDWDRSLVLVAPESSTATATISQLSATTPRNSIIFPAEETPGRTTRYHSREGSLQDGVRGNKKRTLSELLRLHSEQSSTGEFSPEEASRIADVLGQWINASSSPYEGEDDFFARHSQDDINLNVSKKIFAGQVDLRRPRGMSDTANSTSTNSRPSSSLSTAA